MADQTSHVVRMPRSDEEGSFVLVRVSPSGSASRPLNVRLVATEGVAPYVLALRHDRIDKLRGQNAPCSPEEWEQILSFLLLGQGSVDNVDATATVKEESTLTVTIRKRVQNITQRLGTLSLTYDGDEGIELFEWCGEVAEERTKVAKDLSAATAEQRNLQAAVDDLKAQLDEFLETKEADEAVLLENFCLLLNEKKAKIRQQYRQLTMAGQAEAEAAKIAEAEAEIKEEEDMEEDETSAPAPASTRGRRGAARGRVGKVGRGAATTTAKAKPGAKRRAAAAVSEDEKDSDEGGFEKAPGTATRGSIRQKGKEAATAEAEAEAASNTQSEDDDRTTEHDDVSTESEEDAELMDEDVEVKEEEQSQRSKGTKAAKGKAQKQAPKKAVLDPAPAQDEAPPPRRTLAFGKPKTGPAAAPPASSSKDQNMGGSDSESDDEL
ncbi:hypothetical protein SPBR_03716 [Sporothrix brasiliensis 5110]|uniref:XRCC4 coiled-coil domain-containing protein n=1 Tax=Sporothrix brasiliensis 5110 TaxID=1398154 RepID=A0A0C2F7J8_9PEZI|nr:uncharacterized protein SPBR_03716 [Sporothrix brasiliensis 5110]KIH94964.1 hypothetical protein SPBR_03716 [Sporothrix brasiliensis 5110]